ncbi:hypothetical protein JXB11_01535 [Candidatus Woesearchaeota archaeon]|nr:hypothetical protein [Candidatus Woesearchaeota archaeon]
MNTKAQMMGPRKPISLLLGVIFLALGVLPLLNQFGVIGFGLPTIPGLVVSILAIIGAVFLFWDGIGENMGAMGITQQIMFASYIVGVVALAFGLIPLLNSMGVIGFSLPAVGATIINALYVVIGCLLLYGGTQGM